MKLSQKLSIAAPVQFRDDKGENEAYSQKLSIAAPVRQERRQKMQISQKLSNSSSPLYMARYK